MQSSRCLGFRWRVLASGFSLDLLCSGFRGLHRLWRHCGRCPLRQVIERHVIDPLIGRRQLLFHDGPGYLASELLIWGLSPRFTWRFAKEAENSQVNSSVQTVNSVKVFRPNVWVKGTSAASRPRAIRILANFGLLFRGSNMCHSPERNTSIHAAKSPGGCGRGSPMSLRYPVQ